MKFKIDEFTHEQWDEFYSWYLDERKKYPEASNKYKRFSIHFDWLFDIYSQTNKWNKNIKLIHMLFCEYFNITCKEDLPKCKYCINILGIIADQIETKKYKSIFRKTCNKQECKSKYKKTDEYKNNINQAKLQRYGDEKFNNREKFKQTWGNKSQEEINEYIQKIKLSKLRNHGDEKFNNREKFKQTIAQDPDFWNKRNEKSKQTSLKNWGVDSYSKTDDWKTKIVKTHMINNSTPFIQSKQEICKFEYIDLTIDENNKRWLKFRCTECNKEWNVEYNNPCVYYQRMQHNRVLCNNCIPQSAPETEIRDFITSLGHNTQKLRLRNKMEIDIYIPELQIGFEFNGLYWHSNEYKSPDYHIQKSQQAFEEGIHLVHIWEDEWLYEREYCEWLITQVIQGELQPRLDEYNRLSIDHWNWPPLIEGHRCVDWEPNVCMKSGFEICTSGWWIYENIV